MVRPLVDPPRPDEPILLTIGASLRRIIEQARESVLAERINIFDQTAVNMFRDHATKAGQPLLVSLKEGTYSRYCQVWLRLLSFLHRLQAEGFDPTLQRQLRAQLRPEQVERYQRCVSLAAGADEPGKETIAESGLQLDQAVASWSLSLLCHPLHGDRYESGLVSFLALLGINEVRPYLRESLPSANHHLGGRLPRCMQFHA